MIKTLLSVALIGFVLSGCTTTQKQKTEETYGDAQYVVNELQKGAALYFDTGSSSVDPKYDIYLSTAAMLLAKNPKLLLELEGHTDNRGTDKVNNKISLDRANAVRSILVVDYNVNPNQVRTLGAGSSKPMYDNNTAEGRANNRRVSARIYIQQ